MPRVSIILPAFEAHAFIARALRSIRGCGLPAPEVEIVVADDDGTDYRRYDDGLGPFHCVPTGVRGGGAGPARNSALAAATAPFVAFLDADDEWEPGYLAMLLPLAEREGAAFGRTLVLDHQGVPFLSVPPARRGRLDCSDFGTTGASFWPVARRDRVGSFHAVLPDDVLHGVEILTLCGGSCPLAPVHYRLWLREGSICAASDFQHRIDASYADIIGRIGRGETRVPPARIAEAQAVFTARRALNAAYGRDGTHRPFYRYVAECVIPAMAAAV